MKGSDAIYVGMLHVSIHHVVPVFSPADQQICRGEMGSAEWGRENNKHENGVSV